MSVRYDQIPDFYFNAFMRVIYEFERLCEEFNQAERRTVLRAAQPLIKDVLVILRWLE
jgi:hypothetical protein